MLMEMLKELASSLQASYITQQVPVYKFIVIILLYYRMITLTGSFTKVIHCFRA